MTKRSKVLAFLILTVLFFGWTLAIYMVGTSNLVELRNSKDLTALLFGASSIALIFVSIFVGAAALLGWQFVEKALERISKEAYDAAKKSLETEMRGRVLTSVGYFIGESSRQQNSLVCSDRERMGRAFETSLEAYKLLKELEIPATYLALNNMIFFGCLLHDKSRASFLLRKGYMLLDAAVEHDSVNLQLTACFAILRYEKQIEERRKAGEILESILVKRGVEISEKREARLLLTSFPDSWRC